MQIINKQNVKIVEDVCGQIAEMYQSDNLSISIATISKSSTPHKHQKTEEVYFVLSGSGTIFIGGEVLKINQGDLVPIPKDVFHHVESDGSTLEILTVTHPKYNPKDIIAKK